MSVDDRVLIAGAGPVGMIAGLYLARHGVPVTLFDMLPAIPTDHRASTVHPSTLDMLAPDAPERVAALLGGQAAGVLSAMAPPTTRDRAPGRAAKTLALAVLLAGLDGVLNLFL